MSTEHYDMREVGGRARAEAKRVAHRNAPLEFDSIHEAFVCGYAGGLQARPAEDPTDEEVGHVYAEWMNHSPIRDLDAHRLNCSCGERGFTPYGYEHHRLRAGLSAARATRGAAEEQVTDPSALQEHVERALWGVTQVHDARDGRGVEVAVRAPVHEVVAAVLSGVTEEVRKAKAEALREAADSVHDNAASPYCLPCHRDDADLLHTIAAEYETGDSDEHR